MAMSIVMHGLYVLASAVGGFVFLVMVIPGIGTVKQRISYLNPRAIAALPRAYKVLMLVVFSISVAVTLICDLA